ncbi:hypothetical protein LLEC1_02986 [Akanthomyces lecanii]|uniref:Uncharacterized protein n=1 Tax=Cordyceps confragosa TaxID=2714763 RepID=A0A179I6W0_CORDF|nr:hypothetical protein LLEC1_02986 [Akanthomyces lecanii]
MKPWYFYSERAQAALCHLRHGRAGGAGTAHGAAAHLLEREQEAAAERSKEKPHEGIARLQLAAAVLGVAGAVRDPVAGTVRDVGAVGAADAGGEDNGADEGEEDAEAVEHGQDNGHAEAGDDAGHHAVEADDPRQRRDEHGEVYGGAGRGRGDESDAAQDEVEEAGHGEWWTRVQVLSFELADNAC